MASYIIYVRSATPGSKTLIKASETYDAERAEEARKSFLRDYDASKLVLAIDGREVPVTTSLQVNVELQKRITQLENENRTLRKSRD